MAAGLARGYAKKGRKVAFGDGNRIIWDHHSEEIFRSNPNVAMPSHNRDNNLEWIPFYKGHRIYNSHDRGKSRWTWNLEYKAIPGEIYLWDHEKKEGARYGRGFALIEPNVPHWKSVAPNKDWGAKNYQTVANQLIAAGHRVAQFAPSKGVTLTGVEVFKSRSFRDALAILSNAGVYVGPEGGLHHGAAAVSVPAVVLFGGFIPPAVTGYDAHVNLTGGAEACGSLFRCEHCREAMQNISVDEVLSVAQGKL